MKKKLYLTSLVLFQLTLFSANLFAKDIKPPKKNNYEKLFENKKSETASGSFITIHKIGTKLYFEYPLKMLNREMLLSSTTTRSSDNSVSINGYKIAAPLHFRFEKQDSLIYLRRINTSFLVPDSLSDRQKAIVEQNFSDPSINRFPILAYNADSSAVVFEMTKLFLDTSEPYLAPISKGGGNVEVSYTVNTRLSTIKAIKSFEDNISVSCQFGGKYTTKVNNMMVKRDALFTLLSTRSILLLPETKMRPRKSDLRLGTFLTMKQEIPFDGQTFEWNSFANRWNLTPNDVEAYSQNKLTVPAKPIVFYIDSLFPPSWIGAIKKGALRWNKAFEQIGFSNAVQVKDFPKDDPDFDADNLKYSCIRYVPSEVQNAQGPSWVDPSTGEIINASVLIHNNITKLISDWLFVQTSQVDERVRSGKIPDDILMDAMEYVVAHEVGHCLGLMHNMAASAAYPTDSLRSASFTRQYGTTPSIMDYARFNYIAQPGDKGVKLTPPDLGVYDYFAIKWLYSYFPDKQNFGEESPVLESWIDSKANDKMYRYGRQQIRSRYDPSSIEEDLGDDPIKSGTYGILNLKYIVANIDDWVEDDPYRERSIELYKQINRQYYRYLRNVMYNIGGIYLHDVKDGLPQSRFKSVTKECQQASVKWVINELKNSQWINNKKLISGLSLESHQIPFLLVDICKEFNNLSQNITLSAHLSDNAYTQADYYSDLYTELWDNVVGKEDLSEPLRVLQFEMLGYMNRGLMLSGGEKLGITNANIGDYIENNYHPSLPDVMLYNLDNSGRTNQYFDVLNKNKASNFGYGYGWQQLIDVSAIDESSAYYIEMVVKIKKLLESRIDTVSPKEKKHYQALLFAMSQMLGKSQLK